jgi:serine/threonine protein kinase
MAMFLARRQFANFQIESEVGKGGMGVVYKAFDISLGRRVALKVLREEFCKDHQLIAQLDHEAQVTASITHPHVVQVFNSGTCHGMFYIAFELISGGALTRLIQTGGQIAEAKVLHFGIQIASGLAAAAQMGLIHRDIKPANILIVDANTVKIVDFGIARRVTSGESEENEIWATPHYLAPEKLLGAEDFRSDMYSLGATLFHMLAGRPLFEGSQGALVALKHLNSRIVGIQAFAPGVSNLTAFCINRLLQKKPEDRFQSYDEIIEHFQYALDQLNPGKAPVPGRQAQQTPKAKQKKRQFAISGAIILILFVISFLVVQWNRNRNRNRSESPRTRSEKQPFVATHKENDKAPDARAVEAFQRLAEGKAARATELFQQYRSGISPTQREYGVLLLGEGMANYMIGGSGRSREAFQLLRDIRTTSATLDAKDFTSFAKEVGAFMVEERPIERARALQFDLGDLRATALLLAGLKSLELKQYEDGIYFLRRFSNAKLVRDTWVEELKVIARNASIAYLELERYAEAKAVDSQAKRNIQNLRRKYPFLAGKANDVLQLSGENIAPWDPAAVPTITDLRYALYRGKWSKLPDFSTLQPERKGELSDNLIDLVEKGKDIPFGMIFTATLNVTRTGEYTFALASDDGARVWIDAQIVVERDGCHPSEPTIEGKIHLNRGAHAFRIEYFQDMGPAELYVACKGPDFDFVPLSTWIPRETR